MLCEKFPLIPTLGNKGDFYRTISFQKFGSYIDVGSEEDKNLEQFFYYIITDKKYKHSAFYYCQECNIIGSQKLMKKGGHLLDKDNIFSLKKNYVKILRRIKSSGRSYQLPIWCTKQTPHKKDKSWNKEKIKKFQDRSEIILQMEKELLCIKNQYEEFKIFSISNYEKCQNQFKEQNYKNLMLKNEIMYLHGLRRKKKTIL